MGYLCAVYDCGHNSIRDPGFSFFRFPAIIENQGEQTRLLSTERRRAWVNNISRAEDDLTEEKIKSTRVCSDHFISGKPSKLYDRLNPDWAPTQKMGHNKLLVNVDATASLRLERVDERAKKRKLAEEAEALRQAEEFARAQEEALEETRLAERHEAENCKSSQTESIQDILDDAECQTDLTWEDMERQEMYLQSATSQLANLREKLLDVQISQEGFSENDEKTKFYTGLPNFLLLMHAFGLVSPYIKFSWTSSLSKFQQFILVLMRMRLNVPLQDLAYRFNISLATASRIFDVVLNVMHSRMKFLILWPNREELRRTMPSVFKQNFGNKVAVIIDCFEIFVERPSSLIARAMTWSNYKHHNTVKYLIGITPQGSVSFISKGWGGRVSDKYLTDNCKLLNNLLPEDIVLADRGFDIAESVALFQAKLYIPAFTRGKKQLSAQEVEETRKIANVRIHVERVIGLVRRKYVMLQSILSIHLLATKAGECMAPIDKIVEVCCALTNLSDSIVPFD